MTLIKSAEPELIQARNYTLCKRSHAFKYCLLKAQEEVSFFHIQQIDFLILCQFSLANSVISEYAWARVYADNSNLLSAIPALPSHWDSNLYPFFRLLCRTILVLHTVFKTQAAWVRFMLYYLCCLCNSNRTVCLPLVRSGINFKTRSLWGVENKFHSVLCLWTSKF